MLKSLKRVNFSQLFWIFFYFFIFCLLLRNSFNYLDPDFGWHLQVGRAVSQTRSVPSLNQYNYTFTGHWVDHEWLSNVLVAFIYDHWGYLALSVFFAGLIILVLALLNREARRRDPELFFWIAGLQLIGLTAALPHFGVRMQESALLFLFGLLWLINDYVRRQNWRRLLWLLPLMYFWSCLHGSFLIGFFLLAAWLAIKSSERLLARWPVISWLDRSDFLDWPAIFRAAGIAALSFGATWLTPYRTDLYAFLGGYRSTFYLSRIQEWLSQFSFPFHYWQLLYLALVVLAGLLYVYYALGREKRFRLDLWTLFLLVLFVGLSFKSRRHFPLLFVATFAWLAETYGRIFRIAAVRTVRQGLNIWLKSFLLLCLLAVAILELTQIKFTNNPLEAYCDDYPCGAAAFLAASPELAAGHIFNEYGWGGYLIWCLPGRPLFIDGRLPQVEFAGHTFLEEYLDFFKKDVQLSEKFSQYQIKLILMTAADRPIKASNWEKFIFALSDSELNPTNYLRRYLAASSDWREIYRDATAVIYTQD
ncbi:MAG: hypothetical protein WC453_04825 [Patescibacteria group bacterium]